MGSNSNKSLRRTVVFLPIHQVYFSYLFPRYRKRMENSEDPLLKAAPVYDRRYFGPAQEKRRGLRDPLDPRNLFRAIYGYKK